MEIIKASFAVCNPEYVFKGTKNVAIDSYIIYDMKYRYVHNVHYHTASMWPAAALELQVIAHKLTSGSYLRGLYIWHLYNLSTNFLCIEPIDNKIRVCLTYFALIIAYCCA